MEKSKSESPAEGTSKVAPKTSGNARKEMTEWQQQCGTVAERDAYILQHYMWTDAVLTVGVPNNVLKVFEVHRLHLAKSSPLLATLLYEDDNLFKEDTTLKFPNIDPTKIFPAILKYIYEGIVDFESTEMALQMHKAAEELDLPLSFINQCNEYLEQAKTTTTEKNDEPLPPITEDDNGEPLPPKKKMKLDLEQSSNWQKCSETVFVRDKFILEEEKWADCKFKVGDSKDESCKIFSAHRVTLAKTSPVFAAMLYSEMFKPREIIHIPDVTPQAFTLFLSYAYEGKLNVNLEQFVTSGDIWDFMYLAKKYLLPDRLLNQCRAWIFSKIRSKHFWNIMAQCEQNLEQQLFESCLQMLSEFTSYCLKLKHFTGIGLQQLLYLVRQDLLSCPEIDVYNACISWAQQQLVSSRSDRHPQNMLDVLRPVLPKIRFLAMSTQEFLRGPEKSGLIPKTKCYQLLKHMIDPTKEAAPSGFSKLGARGDRNKTRNIYYHGCHPEDLEFSHQSTYAALISHKVHVQGEGCWLLGVRIASQNKPELCQNDCYDEDLTVYFFQGLKDSKDYKLVEKSRFQAYVKYNTYVNVPFEHPVHVCQLEKHFSSYITVVPHTSGEYPHKIHIKKRIKTAPFENQGRVNFISDDCSKNREGFVVWNAYASSLRSSNFKCCCREPRIEEEISFYSDLLQLLPS